MNMDEIVAISLFMKNSLVNYGGINKRKVHVIYPNLPESSYIEKEIEETFTITFIGKLELWKGVSNLLRAFKKVAEKRSNVKLLIVGNGSLEKHLKRFVIREKLQGIVSFKGWVPHSSLPLIMKETDMVVAPSLWPEPFGRTVVEAMLYGKPVLINPVGGLIEQVENGVNGFYTNCFDENIIATKLMEVTDAPRENLIEMGKRAREYVLKKFDNEQEIKKLIKIYDSFN
jgi:glycosyltransferase involved in cell wall biosynthesis